MPKPGRPSKYTPELADEICQRLIAGKSLRAICTADDMPSKSTVMKWLAEKEGFSDQYARAREMQADVMAEDILEIADDGTNDWLDRKNKDGSTHTVIDREHTARSRLRIDTRKWLMARMAPKKYGDRLDLEHSGGISVTFSKVDDAI